MMSIYASSCYLIIDIDDAPLTIVVIFHVIKCKTCTVLIFMLMVMLNVFIGVLPHIHTRTINYLCAYQAKVQTVRLRFSR